MKRNILSKAYFIIALFCAFPLLCSCMAKDEEELQEVEIDTKLIVGQWVNKSDANEHWKYESMNSAGTGTGVYWDSSEMTYSQAAAGPGLFQYYFDKTGLMRIFWMETTESFSNPDTDAPYIIDVLNSTTLTYHNSQRSYSFRKE